LHAPLLVIPGEKREEEIYLKVSQRGPWTPLGMTKMPASP
jgi:hypothetical protein